MNKHIDETEIKCPRCGEERAYAYGTDEIEFNYDGTGHYYVDCHCRDCDKGFRAYFQFEYEITSESTSI